VDIGNEHPSDHFSNYTNGLKYSENRGNPTEVWLACGK